MKQTATAALSLMLGILLLAACGGDGASIVNTVIPGPEELIIEGEWSTDTTELLDTCGFDPFPSYAPLYVEESGASAIFTFADGFGNCEESVRDRSGSMVTLIKTDTFDAGCGVVRVHSSYVYEFTETAISGTATHQYSLVSGGCGNVPCTYQLAIGGTRCSGCWPGCAAVSGLSPQQLDMAETAHPQSISSRKR